MKKIILLIVCFVLCVCSAHNAYAEETFLFKLEIPFEVGAAVTATTKDGTVHKIAVVNKLPTKTRYPSYTASAWSTPGTICASAVNAIHMTVSVENGKGRTMSIIPQETIAPAAGAGAAVVLNCRAGESIFGAWAPPAGSRAEVFKNGAGAPISPENLPREGDILVITAIEDNDMPYMVDIENRAGGRVIGWYGNGYKLLGRVLHPVRGTGRFEGGLFQNASSIRANHAGVIDVTTCERGKMGGFQIIPWEHALTSKELQHVWTAAQWMIIGPTDGLSKLGGHAPLFKNALVSGTADGEKLWDVWSTYGRKSLVLARTNHGDWQRMQNMSGKNNNALKDVTAIRIYYPSTEEILKGEFSPVKSGVE